MGEEHAMGHDLGDSNTNRAVWCIYKLTFYIIIII